ncbi:MAG: AmmeMemoRadiSam system protein A [Planctomycetes bacterium]|nr:AmmeMemoRadiSam system protein A [Planctomycetota bacterium]
MLNLAVRSLEAHLARRSPPDLDAPTSGLLSPRAAFVTWKKGDELRGCMGTLQATESLWQVVRRMAVSAGSRDPRFSPVTSDEVDALWVDVSVLGIFRPVGDIQDIQIGVHGLWIRKGPHSGLLLPQVASERGWDRETFLRQTCRKAGLGEEAWRSGCELQFFDAEVFGEAAARLRGSS